MRNIHTLIKLNQEKLEAKRKIIAALEKQLVQYGRLYESLQNELLKEQQFARETDSQQILISFEHYRANNLRSQQSAKKQIGRLENQINTLRDELKEIFLEKKQFEILRDKKVEQERIEFAKKEADEIDELAIIKHNSSNNESF